MNNFVYYEKNFKFVHVFYKLIIKKAVRSQGEPLFLPLLFISIVRERERERWNGQDKCF